MCSETDGADQLSNYCAFVFAYVVGFLMAQIFLKP